MSLYKFYRAIDGDFEAACRRFYNENMLQKFLIRFLDEPCCAELNDALGRHDRDAAIKAVHTLTGQARSFGFIRLERRAQHCCKRCAAIGMRKSRNCDTKSRPNTSALCRQFALWPLNWAFLCNLRVKRLMCPQSHQSNGWATPEAYSGVL